MSISQIHSPLPRIPAGAVIDALTMPYLENDSSCLSVANCVAIGAIWEPLKGNLKECDKIWMKQTQFCSELIGLNWARNTDIRIANHLTNPDHDYIWDPWCSRGRGLIVW